MDSSDLLFVFYSRCGRNNCIHVFKSTFPHEAYKVTKPSTSFIKNIQTGLTGLTFRRKVCLMSLMIAATSLTLSMGTFQEDIMTTIRHLMSHEGLSIIEKMYSRLFIRLVSSPCCNPQSRRVIVLYGSVLSARGLGRAVRSLSHGSWSRLQRGVRRAAVSCY